MDAHNFLNTIMNLIRLPSNKLLNFLPSSWAPSIYAALKGKQPPAGLGFVNEFDTPVVGDNEEVIQLLEEPLHTHAWVCAARGVNPALAGYAVSYIAPAFLVAENMTAFVLPDQLSEFSAATGIPEEALYSQAADDAAVAALPEQVVNGYSGFAFRLNHRRAQLSAAAAEPAVPVREVTKLLLRRRLRDMGKEAIFDLALDSIPHARSDWDDATSVRTDDPIFVNHIDALKSALGIDDAQLQQLFE